MSQSTAAVWYVLVDGQRKGPLSGSEVRELLEKGEIQPTYPVANSLDAKPHLVVADVMKIHSDPAHTLFDVLQIVRKKKSEPSPALYSTFESPTAGQSLINWTPRSLKLLATFGILSIISMAFYLFSSDSSSPLNKGTTSSVASNSDSVPRGPASINSQSTNATPPPAVTAPVSHQEPVNAAPPPIQHAPPQPEIPPPPAPFEPSPENLPPPLPEYEEPQFPPQQMDNMGNQNIYPPPPDQNFPPQGGDQGFAPPVEHHPAQ